MENNPMAIALVGVIGGIVVCLLGLLITIVMGMKAEIANRDKLVNEKLDIANRLLFNKIDEIQLRLTHMVLVENYNTDKKEITMKLDEHGDRILTLEIRVKGAKDG